jgi:L-threonylcarbamoyladenylate synthase
LKSISDAVDVLLRGGVIAHATEGVWGLACDPLNYEAVKKLLVIKGRPENKGFLLLGSCAEDFSAQLKALSSDAQAQVKASWPGHFTWILPDTAYPSWVSGGRFTIACRVPAHEQARQIAANMERPIVSTSLNLSGQAPIKSFDQALAQFEESVDLVLPGQIGDADGPSKILQIDDTGINELR